MFKELLTLLSSIVGTIGKAASFTKSQRDQYYEVMNETYLLLNTTVNMVIVHTNDVLLVEDEAEFRNRVKQLDVYPKWLEIERKLNLCHGLSRAVSRTKSLKKSLAGKISTQDWQRLVTHMEKVLSDEGELAGMISRKFYDISSSAEQTEHQKLREQLYDFRQNLITERHALIQQEMKIHEII
ncbi:hypothetical protein [Neolewinella sp.]|uniref:hypothetical protein n=1 Tax=Neolewinella sp. TaxID=2993543 RepID=UPI003B521CF5